MTLHDLPTENGILTENILELASRAEDCLIHANNLLKSKVKKDKIPEPVSVWSLFLENPPSSTTIETCAVSIGGSALLATGEGAESDAIQDAASLVAKLQRKDGGWTSFSPTEEEESLTIEAFMALPFFMKADSKKYQSEIQRGIDWLISIEKPETGGWGFFKDDNSHILSTSYAIRVIAEWSNLQGENVIVRDTINRGLSWLVNCQNKDGSWSAMPNQPASAVQTAIALLALIAPGLFRQYSKPVALGRNYLLEHIDNREGVVDNYIVPKRGANGEIVGFHRRISHVNFPEGIILQALLKCGTDLTDRRLINLVRQLVDTQARDGSWTSYAVAYEKPIFAILDASHALNLFTLLVKNSERTLDIKENVLVLRNRIETIQIEQEKIRLGLADTRNTLEQISSMLESIKTSNNQQNLVTNELNEFYKGLFWLRPFALIGNFVRRYPLIALLILIFIVYAILRVFFSVSSVWVDIGTALTSALLVSIELIQFYRSKKGE